MQNSLYAVFQENTTQAVYPAQDLITGDRLAQWPGQAC
jgi:hypothetical protein